jgi:hypothetical protein
MRDAGCLAVQETAAIDANIVARTAPLARAPLDCQKQADEAAGVESQRQSKTNFIL